MELEDRITLHLTKEIVMKSQFYTAAVVMDDGTVTHIMGGMRPGRRKVFNSPDEALDYAEQVVTVTGADAESVVALPMDE